MAVFWTQKQDIGPSARVNHALAYDAVHDRVVVFGGDPGAAPLGDTWLWDGKLWTQVADTGPSARHGAAMAFNAQTQRVELFGGASGPTVLGDTWAWDGGEWTQVADTGPLPRTAHAMAYDNTLTRIVLFGGAAGAGLMGDTWHWDGNEWTQVQDVGPTARRGPAMAYEITAQRTFLFGGAGSSGTGQNDTWAWDGATWTQVADTGPDPRVASALVADGGLLLFGGVNSIDPALVAPAVRTVYGDTWRWVADGWTKVQDIGPAPRWGHGMAYRSQAGKAMLVGGSTVFAAAQDATLKPGLLLDTWELPLAMPQEPGPGPTSVQVASVTVQPSTVAAVGDVIVVGVTLTEPAPLTPGGLQLVAYIFVDDGSGQFVPSQPQGFDLPPSIVVQSGAAATGFQIIRNTDPLTPGNYAIGVGVDTSNMQAGFFSVLP
jgi:hypothetical protein